jgi:hypothetical protein
MTIPRRSLARSGLALCAALLALILSSQATLAAVTWSSPVSAGPTYSWNFGQGLARTKSGTTSYLHTQYTTDFVSGEFATDSGPFLGVYYRRGNSTGTSWAGTKRLNPANEHAANGALAAAGPNVYVAFSKVSHIFDAYDPADPRPVRVAINTNFGLSDGWLSTKNFDAPARVDRPAIAAAGPWAYVVFTDADTGDIHFTTNNGANSEDVGWLGSVVGTTTRQADNPHDGLAGMPVVGAVGDRVMVAWISSDGGGIKAITSTDNGDTWSTPTTVSSAQVWDLAAAGDGTRMALTWANSTSIKVKLFTGSGWQPTRTVATFSSAATYKVGYGPAVALTGSTRVGVAWSACTRSDCSAGSTRGVNLRWRESSNNGADWKSTVTLATYTSSSSKRFNDYPSVVMTSTPRRYVLYNTASSSFSTYKTVLEVGSGTP